MENVNFIILSMAWWQFIKQNKMHISLNKIFNEAYKTSSGLQARLEGLYPLVCNLNFSNVRTASLHLNKQEQIFHTNSSSSPQFTLNIDTEASWKILKEKTIPSKKIEGDSELALMFLMVLAESNIDLEILIYNHFGAVPSLLIRRLLNLEYSNDPNKTDNAELLYLQREFRNIAVRIDRLEQTLVL